MTNEHDTITLNCDELEKMVLAAARRLNLTEDETEELRQNVVVAALERKKKWEKLLREMIWNEAILLKQGSQKSSMLSLSDIDENSLVYNSGPRNEPDIFEKNMLSAKLQAVIESLPEPKRSLCELLKYSSPKAAREKLGMTQREFQFFCDELKAAFVAAGIEP